MVSSRSVLHLALQVIFTLLHKFAVFESLSFLNLIPSYKIPGFPQFVLKCSKSDCVVKSIRLKLNKRERNNSYHSLWIKYGEALGLI